MIEYRDTAEGIGPHQLAGFFEGWPNPPTRETHLALLHRSDEIVVAVSSGDGAVVGFVTALTDGVLAAYIPLLEVRAAFRGRGIGRELVRRLLERLAALYMVDVMCDPDVQPFYEKLGFRRAVGASVRRFDRQSGALAGGTLIPRRPGGA